VDENGILICGCGRIGAHVAELATSRGWRVDAAINRAGTKVGRDWADVSGIGALSGLIIQDSEACDFAAFSGGLAVVTASDQLSENLGTYRHLLSSGINVLCLGGQSTFPYYFDPNVAAELDGLAKHHGVSFVGGSIWDGYRIWPALTLAGTAARIDALHHHSLTRVDDFRIRAAVEGLGVGLAESAYRQRFSAASPQPSLYLAFLHVIARGLGYEVTKVVDERHPLLAEEDLFSETLGHSVSAGLCSGTRFLNALETRQGVTITAYLDARLTRADEVEHMDWRIDGAPGTSLSIRRQSAPEATAACLVNRIDDVIAAPPGIRTVDELGPPKYQHERKS
jgi:secondary-alkyl amine dehydrogenase [NAD(P)+]